MDPEIIVACIGAVVTIITVIATNKVQRKDMLNELRCASDASDARLDKAIAITNTQMEELTREVREHNNFAKRMPALEERVNYISGRLDKLEGKYER